MVKLATSLQHQIRYDYNRTVEVRPTAPTGGHVLTPSPPPPAPSASYVQHLTLAWDTMHTQVYVLRHRCNRSSHIRIISVCYTFLLQDRFKATTLRGMRGGASRSEGEERGVKEFEPHFQTPSAFCAEVTQIL